MLAGAAALVVGVRRRQTALVLVGLSGASLILFLGVFGVLMMRTDPWILIQGVPMPIKTALCLPLLACGLAAAGAASWVRRGRPDPALWGLNVVLVVFMLAELSYWRLLGFTF
jgi:hypothetical protein